MLPRWPWVKIDIDDGCRTNVSSSPRQKGVRASMFAPSNNEDTMGIHGSCKVTESAESFENLDDTGVRRARPSCALCARAAVRLDADGDPLCAHHRAQWRAEMAARTGDAWPSPEDLCLEWSRDRDEYEDEEEDEDAA